MASTGNERFNAEAAAWDSNPDVHRASDGALQAILAAFPDLSGDSPPETDVLEIGCGTGLLTLRLAPYVTSTVAIDAAEGMIDALRAKLERGGEWEGVRDKVSPLCMMLEDPEDARLPDAEGGGGEKEEEEEEKKKKKFDLVTSHLVLHHIADLRALLTTMHGCLKPGTGRVALTDYEDFGAEATKFHPESKMSGVERHGIRRDEFARLMSEVGFVDVDVSAAWTMDKEVERWPGEWGDDKPKGAALASMGFPFLLCRGRRAA